MSQNVNKFLGFVEKCCTDPSTGIKEKGPGLLCWVAIACLVCSTFFSFMWLFSSYRETTLKRSEQYQKAKGIEDEYFRTKAFLNDLINIIINLISIYVIYKTCRICRPSLIVLFMVIWCMFSSCINMMITGNLFSRY
tara:strand:+ start:184 stop:594 length:411 start_codon:yes stop_codon:yes gene_type:complete